MKSRYSVPIAVTVVLAIVAAVALLFLRKGKPSPEQLAPVKYVSDIIGDPASAEYNLVASYAEKSSDGAIYVLGDTSRSNLLATAIMECDEYDNVDGSSNPDWLKDFAGESICTLANFEDFTALADTDENRMRELTVRNAISAMDTLCYVSPYDRSGMGKKPGAKVLVLASPQMVQFGRYDLDTLFHALGCKLPVISSTDLMLDEVFGRFSDKQILTIGVLTGADSCASGIYESLIREKALNSGLDSARCVCFAVPEGEEALTSFLDYYSEFADGRPVDALIVDDILLNPADITASLKRVTSVMNAESMTYGNLISNDFVVIGPASLTCRAIFGYLRNNNLFTHFISQPKRYDYMLLPKEGSEKSYILLPYNERYVPSNN